MKFKRFLIFLLTCLFVIFGLVNPHSKIDAILSYFLTLYIAGVVFLLPRKFSQNRIIILPLIIIFLITSFYNSTGLRQQLQSEPKNRTYRTDMDDFLKTYYLMEQGSTYYESYRIAIENNPFKGVVSGNLWSWRLPTIFYIWLWLPGANGISIYYLFLINCILMFGLSFLLLQHLLMPPVKQYAIIAPYLLYPYLHFAARDMTLLQTEWWGMFVFFFGLFGFIKKKPKWPILLLTLAVIIRELFIIPLIIAAIYLAFKDSKQAKMLLIPILVFGAAIMLHSLFVSQIVLKTSQFFTPRFHSLAEGKQILLASLAFGSWEYTFFNFRIITLLTGIGILGSFLIRRKAILLSAVAGFVLLILVIGTSVYNDYWGIMYIPFMLISAPLVLNKIT